MLNSRQVITTACCKKISVVARSDRLLIRNEYQPAFDVVFDALPTGTAYVMISTTLTSYANPFFPTSFEMRNDPKHPLITKVFANTSIFGTSNFPVDLTISVSLAGSSAGEFTVVYAPYSSLRLISPTAVPAPPVLMTGRLSNDASIVYLNFDSSTDRAGLPTTFPCNRLFDFFGAGGLQCQWYDDSRVVLYVAGSTYISVGMGIGLLSGTIKARCKAEVPSPCNLWLHATGSGILVERPSNPTKPKLQIAAPDTVGLCTDVRIDLSASSGSGGSPWRVSVKVLTSAQTDVSLLENHLNANAVYTRPLSMPASMLIPGIYNIDITICSILQVCSTGQKRVFVVDQHSPTVSIPGPAVRTMTRDEELLLYSFGSHKNCSGDSPAALSYAWTVTANGAFKSLRTSSRQQNVFRLPPYSLDAGTTYVITATVVDSVSQMSAFTRVSVAVVPSPLRAVLLGGAERSVSVGRTFVLDASGSRDGDRIAEASSLTYSWECSQFSPTVSSVCSLISGATSLSRSTLSCVAREAGKSVVTVRVFDEPTGRSSSTDVTVTVYAGAPENLIFFWYIVYIF